MDELWHQRRQTADIVRPLDHRSPFQRDKARILHSAAFRRLQAKTQIMSVGQNDFYRTRLTHSLEAAQIGSALVSQLMLRTPEGIREWLPTEALMEALCLAHDLGHPPFGHGGETVLNQCMQHAGGFEGNAQTFRIVGKLEPYSAEGGMDLTRRTLLGLLKYPTLQPDQLANNAKPVKAIYQLDADLLDWVLQAFTDEERTLFQQRESEYPFKSQHKALDASIMELADDIAYGVHDLEDAVVTGTVHYQHWQALVESMERGSQQQFLQSIGEQLFDRTHYIRKQAIGTLVNRFITAVQLTDNLIDASSPLLRYKASLPEHEQQLLEILKQFIFRRVILHPELQQREFRGQTVVRQLFQAFSSEPSRLLPTNTQERWQQATLAAHGQRIICDYLAGMTDEYALRMHQRLFGGSNLDFY